MLSWDWHALLLGRFPAFLVLDATSNAPDCDEDCRQRTGGGTAETVSTLSAVLASVAAWWRELVAEQQSGRPPHAERLHLRQLLRRYANSTVLPAIHAAVAKAQRWAAFETEWHNVGKSLGLWSALHDLQLALMQSPLCPGMTVWTNHVGPLAHMLCFPESRSALQATVLGEGHWLDADMLAHIFLFAAAEWGIRPGSCRVADVGANVGTVTALLARLGFPVSAVEADPVNLLGLRAAGAECRTQYSARRLGAPWELQSGGCLPPPGSVEVHEVAASDRPGVLTLATEDGKDGAMSTVRWGRAAAEGPPAGRKPDVRRQSIRSAALDDVLLAGRPLCFLKMDIEGSEWRALLGLRRALETVRLIAIEVCPRMLKRSGCASPAALAAAMPGFAHGYIVEERLRRTSRKQIQLRRFNMACLALERWRRWWSCLGRNRSTLNVVMTRVPLLGAAREQAFRTGETVHVSAEAAAAAAWSEGMLPLE